MSAPRQDLASLLKQTNLNDHSEILKAANASLKKSKSDITAHHARLIALLLLERYDDAAKVAQDDSPKLKQSTWEWLYAGYQKDDLDHATLKSPQDQPRGLLHLRAQALYRAEKFTEAAEIYDELSNGPEAEAEEFDLKINKAAVEAQLEWSSPGNSTRKHSREDMDTFESAFNAACGCIARRDFVPAQILLKRAEQLCSSSDDLSDDIKKTELPPILIQQAYVLSTLGKHEEATKLCESLAINDISDLPTRHLAYVNYLSSKETNPYLAHRGFYSTPAASSKDRPFQFQKSILDSNADTLNFQTHKSSAITASSTDSPSTIPQLLLAVQLAVIGKKSAHATTLIENFIKSDTVPESTRRSPGLIAVLTALYNSQSRNSEARSTLLSAATHSASSSTPNASLLHAAGAALLATGNDTDLPAAKKLFTKLLDLNSSDKRAAAGLVACGSTDKHLLSALTPASRLISQLDASALEDAGIPHTKPPTAPTKRAAPAGQTGGRKRRLAKSRMPKDYVEGKQMDPERWLPLKDRNSWRPKGRKGKARQAGLTQGGPVEEKETAAPRAGAEVAKAPPMKKKKGKSKK
ncbi:hypothetical protein BT63DRAFT_408469 [Microthyrium microscopicum]|uniref:Signal recognition particle subunit SRP72 n=1 Tax=Microthyrium microscopicum TaxID=703497 RepID=A0A6A6UR85_9PEZI|nr:hypothetical protein BT63DRAFT_408469 [Microthyrium microscopicum]